MFKFIHTADIHLDSPLLNLDGYDGAPVELFRGATRAALDSLVELAIEQRVAFVLIAGDLYDGECRDSSTPLHFRRQMLKLAEHDIRVFMIQGNHDAGMPRQFRLQLPENTHLFSTKRPETVRLDDHRVAIHGQGFADREVTEDLSAGYPAPVPGWLNIGLLHTACANSSGGGAHDPYAPSTVRGLTNKGYQYWALGHIHKRETMAGPNPYIVYSGNLQGRHIGEPGAKGCEVVTVEHGEITSVRHCPLDVIRWQRAVVDASDCACPDDVVAATLTATRQLLSQADGRPLAVRLEIKGASPAHHALAAHADHWDRSIREHHVDVFDEHVFVEKIKFHTQSLGDRREHFDGVYGQLLAGIGDDSAFGTALAEVREEYQLLSKYVRSDPRLDARIDLEDEAAMASFADEVREMLIGRLLERSEPE